MMTLFKALIKPKLKTVFILILTAVIVMLSIHTNGSLNGSDLEIIKRLDDNRAAHANVILLESVFEDDESMNLMFNVLESFKDKGVNYAVDDYPYLQQSRFMGIDFYPVNYNLHGIYVHNDTNFLVAQSQSDVSQMYEVVKGKDLAFLELNEIAIPYNMLSYYDLSFEEAIGSTITITQTRGLYSRNLIGSNPQFNAAYCEMFSVDEECYTYVDESKTYEMDFTVSSLVQKISEKKASANVVFNPSIDFFKPDETQSNDIFHFVNQDSIERIESLWIDTIHDMDDILLESVYNLSYVDDDLIQSVKESLSNKSEMEPDLLKKKIINIRFDKYSKGLENELAEAIGKINVTSNNSRRSGFRLDSLASKLDKEPMVTSVLKVLSQYVLLGVLLSSFYSFYIHFRNQIRTSTKEISALLMQGIPWSRICATYLWELFVVFLVSVVVFGTVSSLIHVARLSDVLYSSSVFQYRRTILWSVIYFVVLSGIVVAILRPFRKDILMKYKKAAQTQLSFVSLTYKSMIRDLSVKRVFKYIASTLGFAFSISLVIAVIVLSFSSSYHLRNLYSKETFGIQFDYMIRFTDSERPNQEIYDLTYAYAETQAPIHKQSDILFMDHSLWGGNSNFYKSSEIIFFNEIEAFVPLQSGTYPPHWSEIKGEFPDYKREALVSRRHLDKRDINKKKNEKRVEDSYLFYYENEDSFYENAYQIYGTVNALYNNGWVLSTYNPEYVSPENIVQVQTDQYVLNLKEGTDVTSFETLLTHEGVEFLKYDSLMEDFQAMNIAMNETALLISATVILLMSVLLSINIGGVLLSIKMEVEEDNLLFKHLGLSQRLLSRVDILVLILRGLVSFIFLLVLIMAIYPFFFNDLLSAFGLFSMPGSILPTFSFISAVCVLILIILFVVLSHRKINMPTKP